MSVHMSEDAHEEEKEVFRPSGAWGPGGCQLPNKGTEHQTQVICSSSTHD